LTQKNNENPQYNNSDAEEKNQYIMAGAQVGENIYKVIKNHFKEDRPTNSNNGTNQWIL